MENEENSNLEEYVLLSKDDYLNVLNQQDQSEQVNDQIEFLLTGQEEQQSKNDDQIVDYYLTGNEDSNENKESINDRENKNELDDSSQMYREQDLYLPITNISRIMKQKIPSNGKLSKESKTQVQECVSEFISFITMEACDMVKSEKRRTLNGEDLINAMESLGFDNYIEPLRIYLKKYRQLNSTTCLNGTDSSADLLNDNQHK